MKKRDPQNNQRVPQAIIRVHVCGIIVLQPQKYLALIILLFEFNVGIINFNVFLIKLNQYIVYKHRKSAKLP